MSYATDLSPLVVDIETAPLTNVRDFLDAPDLENLKAPGNYTKADSIAKWIEEEKVKRLAEFETDCTDKAALDFNTARIVALGRWFSGGKVISGCADEQQEAAALEAFWRDSDGRMMVGFSIREFDMPMLIQRSRYLGVAYRTPDLGRFARGSSVIDLRDLLTFNDLRYSHLMPRSLKCFARRFGLPVTDPVNGGDIPGLIAAGDWTSVLAHVDADLDLTVALARRLGVIHASEAVSA